VWNRSIVLTYVMFKQRSYLLVGFAAVGGWVGASEEGRLGCIRVPENILVTAKPWLNGILDRT